MLFNLIKLFTDPIQLAVDGQRGLMTVRPVNHSFEDSLKCHCDMCKNPEKYSPVIWPKWIFNKKRS